MQPHRPYRQSKTDSLNCRPTFFDGDYLEVGFTIRMTPLSTIIRSDFLNPRSGWKRKAWGEAKRNPRLWTVRKQSARSVRQQVNLALGAMNRTVAALRGLYSSYSIKTWGSASRHPRLYAVATLRGLGDVLLVFLSGVSFLSCTSLFRRCLLFQFVAGAREVCQKDRGVWIVVLFSQRLGFFI